VIIDLPAADVRCLVAAVRLLDASVQVPNAHAIADRLDAQLNDPDPEPVFPIKARDLLGGAAVQFYRAICRAAGLDRQAYQVSLAMVEMGSWQAQHPTRCHLPDHQHQPAGS
jgi:hypothetical protein